MTLRTARILVAAGAFAAGLILFVTIILLVAGRESGPAVAAIGGPFTLTDQNGGTITDRDFKGRPSLVFFGFTQCPDICPTSMFEISEVLRKLGRDGDRARALFITVDPERDTPQMLKEYLSSFDSRIVGATGSPEAIAAVAKAYRAVYRRVPLKDGGYTMDHTAVVYLMDKQGRFVSPFSLRRTTGEAAADLRRYL
jgi:protein SCO1/2